jgi:hypothetical protein
MIHIPFASRVIELLPEHRDEARAYFQSPSGQAILACLEQVRPQPTEAPFQSGKVSGYEEVFQNLAQLIDPQKPMVRTVRDAYPALDDKEAWDGHPNT